MKISPTLYAALGCLALNAPIFAAPAQTATPPAPVVVEKVPVSIGATLSKKKFNADEPVDLRVSLVNKSNQTVVWGESINSYSAFRLELSGDATNVVSQRKSIKRTAFGEDFFTPMSGSFGNTILRLPPKSTLTIVFPLRRLFDLSTGGHFSVDVRRTFNINQIQTGPRSYREETETKSAPWLDFSVEAPPQLSIERSPKENDIWGGGGF